MRISVVIPVLNEAEALPETLRRILAVPEVGEIIVVDGGSGDSTRVVAANFGCKVLEGPLGRGGQMRLGCEAATQEVILLTHADTWLPPEAGREAVRALQRSNVVAGGFWKSFRDPHWLMRGARFRCWLRLMVSRRILGDQCLFCLRETLVEVGGVPELPLMEDVELCRVLGKMGRLVLANATVSTSARRFRKHGVLRTYSLMWKVTLQHWLRADPAELRRMYERG